VVGRAVDTEPGFNYSGALLQVGETWTPEVMNHFLTSPKAAAPGTAMGFAGLPKEEDRANVIAYLDSLDN
jgi:cytochrome c